MLEQLDTTSNSFEIHHFPNIDLLTSKALRDSGNEAQIVEMFKAGLPSDFLLIGDQGRFYIDSSENPKLFVKQKWFGPIQLHNSDYPMVVKNAFSSIMNELVMTPMLADAIDSSEIQEWAKKAGFKSLRFVQPVAGFINREEWLKYMVYPYIKAEKWLTLDFDEAAKRESLIAELGQLLSSKGIEPFDIDTRHILVDPERNAYLIDSEGFHKTSEKENKK